MKSIKKIATWGFLLTKRLYKKPAFIVILLIIPLLTIGFSVLAKEESGFVTIALAQEAEDGLSADIITKLTEEDSMIRFLICDDAEDAESKVKTGKADAAWIFPDDMEQRIADFVESGFNDGEFIKVVQREESVLLIISREKLTGVLFESLSKECYLQSLRNQNEAFAECTDEELLRYFDGVERPEKFFVFEYSDSDIKVEESTSKSMLITPLMGLLALVMLISGLATSMYFVKDKENGLFLFAPSHFHPLIEFGYQLISAINVAVVMTASLGFAGLTDNIFAEILAVFLYGLCVSAFCMMFRSLVRNKVAISVATPFVAVLCLVVCPIFFNIVIIKWAQLLLPPTYYISAGYQAEYFIYALIYCLVLWVVYGISERLRKFR